MKTTRTRSVEQIVEDQVQQWQMNGICGRISLYGTS